MAHTETGGPVVVGIDGSKAAVAAALWAVDEAISRNAALRMVHVVDVPESGGSGCADVSLELQYAETELRAAEAAVHSSGEPVKVDTVVRRGGVEEVLLEESRSAAMVCVGSCGIGAIASRLFGSTAVALATRARCPAAVIRTNGEPLQGDWIVVVVDNGAHSDEVIRHGFHEARLRKAPLLALGVWRVDAMRYDELGQRLEDWLPRYPDVEVTLCASRGGPMQYLVGHDESVQLLVTGAVDAQQLTGLLGPHGPSILAHPQCSVLVVRD